MIFHKKCLLLCQSNNKRLSTNAFTIGESSIEFFKGALIGDFDVPDTIPGLIGQISASFVPVAADVRDYFANVFVNQDTKAAIWNVAGFSSDFLIGAGISVDALKAVPKVGKFVSKFSKNAAMVLDALRNVIRRLPGSNKLVPAIAGAIPSSAYDDIYYSVKNGDRLTKEGYEVFEQVCKEGGKNISKTTKFIVQNSDLASDIAKISESALDEMITIVGEKTARKFVKHSNHFARDKRTENEIKS